MVISATAEVPSLDTAPTDTRCSPGPSAASGTITHSPFSSAVVRPRMTSPSNTVISACGAALPANTALPSGLTWARSIETDTAAAPAEGLSSSATPSVAAVADKPSAGASRSPAAVAACPVAGASTAVAGGADVVTDDVSVCGSIMVCSPVSSKVTARAIMAMAAPAPTRM